MIGPGDEVVISNHGGGQPRRVRVFDVQVSEELSGPGEFSAFAHIDDLRAAGLGWDLLDRWVTWDHPVWGRWGGVIVGQPKEPGQPIVEIMADGWAALLGGHLLLEFERVPEGGAGGLARRAVVEAGATHPTFISIGMIDEGGEPISVTFGGQDVLSDVLGGMASAGEVEWLVDADRVFHAGRRLGRDRSARIRLVQDRHIIEPRLADDAWAGPPDELFSFESVEESARRRFLDSWGSIKGLDPHLSLVAGIPDKHRPARKKHRRRHQGRSRSGGQPGARRHRSRGKGGGGKRANMPRPAPHWALAPVGVGANNPAIPGNHPVQLPTVPVDFTLINVDGMQRLVALGDTVRLELARAGFAGRFRVMSRALDVASGEMTVAGEALADDY